ncbi:hypothetical protein [Streptomyces sp. NPDC006012]|uniref:hypothetical protein n=1 Tax=Streptomyces sp. NPDC006012 TaxID=3364739 RepID=UPI00368520E4
MQYEQRRLHRSSTDNRRSVWIRPNRSINGALTWWAGRSGRAAASEFTEPVSTARNPEVLSGEKSRRLIEAVYREKGKSFLTQVCGRRSFPAARIRGYLCEVLKGKQAGHECSGRS